MKALWIVIWIICLIDCYMLSRYKVVFGDWQRNRNTEGMTWHRMLECFILIGVLLIITSNRTGTDIVNYYYWYIREQVTTREPLYTFLRIVAHRSGMSFYVFRTILTALSGILLCGVCWKNEISITFFMSLYMPALLFADSMQFRNAIALSIMIPATYLLFSEDNVIRNIVLFAFCVILAGQFHTSFYAYLIFLPMTSKHKKTYGKLIFIFGFLLLLVSFLNNRTVPLINVIYNWILSDGDTRSYRYAGGHMIFLYPMTVHLLSTGLLWYFAQFWDAENEGGNIVDKKYIDFINVMNLVFFVFVPLTMMSTTFYRHLRNMYVFDIISAYYLIRNLKETRRSYLIFFAMLVIALLWLYFMIGVYSTPKIIIDPIFKNGIWFWK